MRSVNRLLSILSVLGQYPDGIGVVDLAKAVGLPASSLHRGLRALVHHELVWQHPTTRRYSLGLGLLQMSLPALDHSIGSLRQDAQSLLAELTERTREQVFLSVLAQDRVMGVESALATAERHVRVISSDARPVPFHCGASAKAILAFLPPRNREQFIGRCNFRPYTMYTLLSPEDLLQHLDMVRNQGYAMCDQEFEIGVTALAVPVLDRDGRAYASLGVCAPSPRLAGNLRRRAARFLQDAAQTLGRTGLRLTQPPASQPVLNARVH